MRPFKDLSDGRTASVKQVVKFSLLLYGEDVGTAANQSIGIGINGGGDPYWEMKMDSSSERACELWRRRKQAKNTDACSQYQLMGHHDMLEKTLSPFLSDSQLTGQL